MSNNNNNLNIHSNKLDVITPCSTPNQKRKDTNRRRSNLFTVIVRFNYIYLFYNVDLKKKKNFSKLFSRIKKKIKIN